MQLGIDISVAVLNQINIFNLFFNFYKKNHNTKINFWLYSAIKKLYEIFQYIFNIFFRHYKQTEQSITKYVILSTGFK